MENNKNTGVFYFADDDNTYDGRVFNLIRSDVYINPPVPPSQSIDKVEAEVGFK